jgi:hypothetical protein
MVGKNNEEWKKLLTIRELKNKYTVACETSQLSHSD